MPATVELEGVGKRYGQRVAVDQVTLRLAPEERVALVGHNGAGKTTLMKLMLGLIRPSSGKVRVLGGNPASGAAARARLEVGFLPENVAFHETMTGLELMRFYARLKGRPHQECTALLERVGLQEAARLRVRTYSKGMRQRLGLAQALLGTPRLLLLDEPTTGLDPALRQRFYEIIRDLKETGTTVLLSSHLLTELEERTDRIVIMNRGRLIAQGPLAALRQRARLPVQIRISVIEGAADEVIQRLGCINHVQPAGGPVIEFTCPAEEKVTVLRQIAALGSLLRDIDIVPPSLDDIYTSLVSREGEQA
jgi:Cu-processing system ATP-binding protein